MSAFRAASVIAPLVLAAAGTGCLTPDQIASLQNDVADIRVQMEALRKEHRATAASIDSMKLSLQGRDEARQDLGAEAKRQFDAIRDDLRIISTRLDELQQRLSGFSRVTPPSRPPPAAAPPPSERIDAPIPGDEALAGQPAPIAGPADQIFNAAYADYSKGNYAPAILGFQEFLRRAPDADRADDALYWIGLCHYDQGQYGEAISSFDRLVREYPDGDKVPGAHLKKGLSLLEMNRTAQGVVQLQFLIEKFPRTEDARVARERLKELGVRP